MFNIVLGEWGVIEMEKAKFPKQSHLFCPGLPETHKESYFRKNRQDFRKYFTSSNTCYQEYVYAKLAIIHSLLPNKWRISKICGD